MKKKQLQDHRKKSLLEIEKAIREHRKKMTSLTFDQATGKLSNAREVKSIKKSIAQLLTIKKEQEKIEMSRKSE
jgi:ribosomal protein L29